MSGECNISFSISLKVFFGLVSFVISLIGFFLNFGNIWYEHTAPDIYRTLVNKMSAILAGQITLMVTSWMSIVFSVIVLEIHHHVFCLVSIALSFVLSLAVLIVLGEIVVLQYLYTCVFKSVGALNEEFFKHFICLNNALMLFFVFASAIMHRKKD